MIVFALILYQRVKFETEPLRTRPPPTPTRSINRVPSVISGSIIITLFVLSTIAGTVFFFIYQKRSRVHGLTQTDSDSQTFMTDPDKSHRSRKLARKSTAASLISHETVPLLPEQDKNRDGDDGNELADLNDQDDALFSKGLLGKAIAAQKKQSVTIQSGSKKAESDIPTIPSCPSIKDKFIPSVPSLVVPPDILDALRPSSSDESESSELSLAKIPDV